MKLYKQLDYTNEPTDQYINDLITEYNFILNNYKDWIKGMAWDKKLVQHRKYKQQLDKLLTKIEVLNND